MHTAAEETARAAVSRPDKVVEVTQREICREGSFFHRNGQLAGATSESGTLNLQLHGAA
jgi:hypothetical protein